jgi:predicted dehydrogenase
LKTSTATAASASLGATAFAAGGDTIKVGLIGCGKRGIGAAANALSVAGPVKLWAMADAFEDRLEDTRTRLESGEKVKRSGGATSKPLKHLMDVPPERRFVGLDAYKKCIDSGVDVVLLVTPPAFRPAHFRYAVEKNVHVFMEKPVAVDAPGVREAQEIGKLAAKKNLKVGVGLQRHHQKTYQETIKRLHDGAIGDVLSINAAWNTHSAAESKQRDRQPGWTEIEHQIRNWYYFTWLGGDHIVEQHVHNLDVSLWVMGEPPAAAVGWGGRQVRTDPKYGMIFDHHAVEYSFKNGSKIYSTCRQIPNTYKSTHERAQGSKGFCNVSGAIIEDLGGKRLWAFRGDSPNPYQVEHDVLFDAIRNNKTHNETEFGAMSTMIAIHGRMATYSGQLVRWETAYNSKLSLTPPDMANLTFDTTAPIQPNPDGTYESAKPGITAAL